MGNWLQRRLQSLPPGIRERLNPTAMDFGGTFALRVFFLGSAFVVRFLLARTLGAAGLGEYNYALAWIDILLIFTLFGVHRLVVREIPGGLVEQNWAALHGLLRFATRVPMLLSILLMIGAVAAILGMVRLGIDVIPATAVTATLIATLQIPIRTLVRVRQGAMQGLREVIRSHFPEYVVQPILFIIMLVIAWLWLPEAFSAEVAVGLFVVSNFIALLYGDYLLRRAVPPQVYEAPPHYQVRLWLLSAAPLMAMTAMNIINDRLDMLMLGSLASTEAVGIYTTAMQFARLLVLVLSTSNTVLAPRFAALYRIGKIEELQRLVTRSTRIVFFMSLLFAGIMLLFGEFLLGIFGREFTAGNTALQVMIFGQLVNAFTGSTMVLLQMTSHARLSAIALVISTIFNIIANFALIPTYGVNGAALATALTMILLNIVLSLFVWKNVRIVPTVFGTRR